jgi:hypothetical protein
VLWLWSSTRGASVPAAPAENSDAHRRQVDIRDLQSRQLGHAQPRADGQMQHGPVADAIARGGIRSVKHGLQFLAQKIRDQASIRFLERDRQDAADLLQGCRLSVFEEAENDLMAASRTLRVTAAFLRTSSRCSRKALTDDASATCATSKKPNPRPLFGQYWRPSVDTKHI